MGTLNIFFQYEAAKLFSKQQDFLFLYIHHVGNSFLAFSVIMDAEKISNKYGL